MYGLNPVSFQQTLQCFSQLLNCQYNWESMTPHARYRQMTFTVTHFFPLAWKAAVLRQRHTQRRFTQLICMTGTAQSCCRTKPEELPEEKRKVRPHRNCGLCAHKRAGSAREHAALPTDCLLTVVMGDTLRQQLIQPGFAINHNWRGQKCERMETFGKIRSVCWDFSGAQTRH